MFADKPRFLALVGICIVGFVAFLDFTIVNVALPIIQKELQVPVTKLQWLISLYFITVSMFMIVMGRLGDLYGVRLLFILGAIGFIVASLVCGVATNIDMLIGGRIFQGIAAAILYTIGAALVAYIFPEGHERNKAMGIYGAVNGVGIAVGPTLGGFLIGILSWRWVFLINVPIGLVGLIVCFKYLHVEQKLSRALKIDWRGMILVGVTIISISLGFINATKYGWHSQNSWFYFLVFIIALPSLIFIEKRHPQPLLQLEFFKRPSVIAGMILCSSGGLITTIMLFFNPLFLHAIKQQSAMTMGLTLFAIPLMSFLVPMIISHVLRHLAKVWLVVISLSIAICACLLALTFTQTTSLMVILMTFLFVGASWGIVNVMSALIAQDGAASNETGAVVGTVFTSFNIVASVGLALAVTIFQLLETAYANIALEKSTIVLSIKDQAIFKALLADPQNALQQLATISQVHSKQLFDIFSAAFMRGYHGAMLLLLCYLILCLIAMVPITKKILHRSG